MSKKNHTTEPVAPQAVSAQFSDEVIKQRLTPNPLSQFSMDKDSLRLALVTAQYALRATRQQTPSTTNKPTGLLVLVNGMEQAGKGTAVKQLRQWVDPRLLKVEATIGYCPLNYQPIWQAHTKVMPRHGDVTVYFGNWYADLLYNVMRMAMSDSESGDQPAKDKSYKNINDLPTTTWQDYLQQQLIELQAFEDDLIANHTRVLKCWFHVDVDTLQNRLNDAEADPQFLYQVDWHSKKVVEKFNEVATILLRQQDDWIVIDGEDKSQAADHFCHEALHAMQTALVSSKTSADTTENQTASIKEALSETPDAGWQAEPSPAPEKFEPVNIPDCLFLSLIDRFITKMRFFITVSIRRVRIVDVITLIETRLFGALCVRLCRVIIGAAIDVVTGSVIWHSGLLALWRSSWEVLDVRKIISMAVFCHSLGVHRMRYWTLAGLGLRANALVVSNTVLY